MSKISEHNLYSIDDLVIAGESGWKDLERFARLQYHYKLSNSGDDTKPHLERIHLAIKDILIPYVGIGEDLMPKTIPKDTVMLNLAATKTVYKPVKLESLLTGYPLGSWAKDKVQLHKSLQKITNAFATSDDYGQVFSKIATKKNIEIFKEHWSKQDCRWAKGEYLTVEIGQRLKGIMKWLGYGLSSKAKCQEAWWNCLWLFMEPALKIMREIEKRIKADVPLYQGQIKTLNYYISHGYPEIVFFPEDDGKQKHQVVLRPHTPKMLLNSPFEVMSVVLLTQPAFDLSQQLQNTFSKARFIKQCHAPSCGKLFYTQRKTQVVCGGGKGNNKTRCALEWQQYRNWLNLLTDTTPERDWCNPRCIRDFLDRNR